MPDVLPYPMVKPHIEVTATGGSGTAITLECFSTGFDMSPEQDSSDIVSFCATVTTYKPEKWTIVATVVQSFGAEGLWTLMRPLVGQVVDYTVIPYGDDPVSVDNPSASGQARVKTFTFIKGKPGEPDEFDLELACTGVPVFSITPGATTTAAEAEETEAEAETETEDVRVG